MQGKDLVVVRSNKARRQELGIKCIEGCPFYLYASWHSRNATLIVRRVVNEHLCQRDSKKNRQFTTRWTAKEMLEVFKVRPHWPAKDIQETIRRAYKVRVSFNFAYNVKYKAHKMLHGSMQDHYNKVGNYIAAMKEVSPATVLDLLVDDSKEGKPPIFQRFFNCFEGLSKGWKEGCRRVICVDATFLKTFLGGQLISAVGRDTNDQMFPIAWAVVEGENNFSWEWFFEHIQCCLELGDGSGFAIISDEHPAILHAVSTILPKAEHRHCARHIYAHWQKRFRGDEMKLAFWKIAKAYNLTDFNEALEELNEKDPAAATSFQSYNPENFCRAYMRTEIKCDAITNNMAETFNGYIIQARTKHLLYMMEDISGALMERVATKKKNMEKQTSLLCPRIKGYLEIEKDKASLCDVIPSTDNIFSVTYYLDSLVVDLDTRSCTCRKWDMMGVPCCHAVACIFFLNKQAEEYVDDCYKREVYLRSYSNPIPAIPGERHWLRVEQNIVPPLVKIGPGRPRKNRIKDPYQDLKKPGRLTKHGMEMTCQLCNQKGHKKRGCPQKDTIFPQGPPPKKARGIPRKYQTTTTAQEDVNASAHHLVSAQPTQLGRGGRMILGGVGARGRGRGGKGATGGGGGGGSGRGGGAGGSGRSGGSGRGSGRAGTSSRGGTGGGGGGRTATTGRGRGKSRVPHGVGVLFRSDGTPMTTVVDGAGRTRTVDVVTNTQASQGSCIVNNTQ